MSETTFTNYNYHDGFDIPSKDGGKSFTAYKAVKTSDGQITGFLRGVDFDKDGKEVMAIIKNAPADFPTNNKLATAYLKANIDSLFEGSETKHFASGSLTDEVFEAEIRNGRGVNADKEKIHIATGNEGHTTLHINKENGAVHSSQVLDHMHGKNAVGSLSQKFAQKAGVAGGVVAAGIGMATGASASEIVANAVPGGNSAVSVSKGNFLESGLQLLEETGIGSLVTEAARPALRAMGAKVESGLVEDMVNGARDFLKSPDSWSSGGIKDEQKRILGEAGFPDKVGKTPIEEALRDPATMKKYKDMMVNIDNPAGMTALNQYAKLDDVLQKREKNMAEFSNMPTMSGMVPGQII